MKIALRIALILSLIYLPPPAHSADFSGSAFVQDDGSLHVRNRDVTLWGIVFVNTREDCLNYVRPPVCGPRAILALKEGLEGFVRCTTIKQGESGRVQAQCFTGYSELDEGVDLAAYLLNRGWALASDDAPPHYRALETIGRHNGLGLWGTSRATLP